MRARFSMVRGAPASKLPKGTRQDTRKHTRHVLRPEAEMVLSALGHGDAAWRTFARDYRALLDARFKKDRTSFDELAELARNGDVYLGCSRPTKKNPDVRRCHTALAHRFSGEKHTR